jgi:hypothetical protein
MPAADSSFRVAFEVEKCIYDFEKCIYDFDASQLHCSFARYDQNKNKASFPKWEESSA